MNQISFACPSCQTVLHVPASMAGVTGPCPRCSSAITSPHLPAAPPSQPHVQSPPQAPLSPQTTPPQQQSPPHPAHQQQLQQPTLTQHQVHAPTQQGHAPSQNPTPKPPHDPNVYRRSSDPTPEISPLEKPATPANEDHKPTGNGCLYRILFPLIFFGALALGIISVLIATGKISPALFDKSLEKQEDRSTIDEFETSKTQPDTEQPAAPPTEDTETKDSTQEKANELAEGATPPPSAIAALNEIEDNNPVNSQNPSYDTLIKFFEQDNFSDRIPFFSSNTYSEDQLKQSCLNSSIPTPIRTIADSSYDQPDTKDNQVYYSLLISKTPDEQPTRITVQLSQDDPTQPFKLNVDPFLELYGDTFPNFAKEPTENGMRVHAIIEAIRANFNDKIPDYKKWGYVKVRKHREEDEFFRAYFKLNSTMAKLFEKEDSPGWSNAYPARIHLKWNTEDNPDVPFIELLRIDHFGWKP